MRTMSVFLVVLSSGCFPVRGSGVQDEEIRDPGSFDAVRNTMNIQVNVVDGDVAEVREEPLDRIGQVERLRIDDHELLLHAERVGGAGEAVLHARIVTVGPVAFARHANAAITRGVRARVPG